MRDNDYQCYPTKTANHNVPADAFLVAEYATDDGAVIVTYYVVNGFPYVIYNFEISRPHRATIVNLLDVTGDTIEVLRRWYNEYLEQSPIAEFQR